MCMKYEEAYNECFDMLEGFGNEFQDQNLFLSEFGVKVVDNGATRDAREDALELCHEKGFIRPATAVEQAELDMKKAEAIKAEAEVLKIFDQIEAKPC